MQYNSMINQIIQMALAEDLGTGDITSESVVPADSMVHGHFIAKEKGVICGLEIMKMVFSQLDPHIQIEHTFSDGDKVETGTIIATIEGPARSILSAERTALNFLQHLSGIATRTSQMVEELAQTPTRIVDTRKTSPGMRILEKYAVKTGGGSNHRMNLSDGILIKDNHIKAAGGITPAVHAARQNAPQTLKIEVETETLSQVREALEAGADIIMLDNMSLEDMKQATELVKGRALTEASGNMDQKDLREVAHTGVDLISVGALTHSVKAMDISLRLL